MIRRRGDKEKLSQFSPVTMLEESPGPAPELVSEAIRLRIEERRRSAGRLGDVLIAANAITRDQLDAALHAQQASGLRLGEVLVDAGFLDTRTLASAVADQLGLGVADLRHETPEPDAVSRLPETVARGLNAVPIRTEDGALLIAVADPLQAGITEQLAAAVRGPVSLLVAPADDIRNTVNSSYRAAAVIERYVEEFESGSAPRGTDPTSVLATEDAPVVQVVSLMVAQAVRDRASDIHIEPRDGAVHIRSRIDGALHDTLTLPVSMGPAVVSRIKVLAGMDIVERRRPQDGQMRVDVDGRKLDLRISTTPVVWGEKVVLRVLDKSKSFYKLLDLGMPQQVHRGYSELVRSPFGMVVCAGPTGSGKTTTLYATLAEINQSDMNVMTVEDPVEYVIPEINQIQINEPAGVTFAEGLRSILRQDPDAILVGEMRDAETAGIAVQAALTGHFVLSSMHATDAASAVHRFLDMRIEPYLVASSVLAVVGQRLVRRICSGCKTPYSPTSQEQEFYEQMGGAPKEVFYKGMGCNLCAQTGYQGRIGAYEVLTMTDPMRELVLERASHQAIRSLAVEEGMRPLRAEAMGLVGADVTTVAEIVRSVYPL